MHALLARHVFPALLASTVVFSASQALAADRVVTIVNQTGVTLVEFYGSNAGTRSWEEDILGADVLNTNESIDIDFDDGTRACQFDFKAVFADGDVVTDSGINVCEVGRYTYE